MGRSSVFVSTDVLFQDLCLGLAPLKNLEEG
jgi:hypothetical protein